MEEGRCIRVLLAAATASLVMEGLLTSSAASAPTRSTAANRVTITRDSSGIPHITAGNFTSLGYGEALAFSQDNFCTLAQDFVTVNGQRSKYFGPRGLSLNYSAGADDTNLNSDFFWRSVKASGMLTRRSISPLR